MSQRRLYLDDGPGERRGVVALDGAPERLLTERLDDIAAQQPGARLVARVRRVERALRSAFLDLGEGADAILPLTDAKSVAEGAWLEVRIVAPVRAGKGAVARLIALADGPVRLIEPAPDLSARLAAFEPSAPVITGGAARKAADVAEEVALKIEHPLPNGGRIFIEPTQALTAIDVDLGASGGDSRRAAVRANGDAVIASARLLRLKGLGGLVAIDLAGKGHDGDALRALAKTAFAPDGPEVSIGPISRFGVFELALPRTQTPAAERLLRPDGRPSAATMALRLMRRIEDEAGPGRFVDARCAPDVADIAARLAPLLTNRIGARFAVRSQASQPSDAIEVTAR